MKKPILTLFPAVCCMILNAQITEPDILNKFLPAHKFTQTSEPAGKVFNRLPDLSKVSSSGDLFFCDSVYGYMFYSSSDSSLDYKNIYTYDVHGKQSTYAQYTRDKTSNQWIIMLKDSTAYTSTDKLALERMLYWNTNTKKPSGGWGYDNTFDASGNRITAIEYKFDTLSNQFVFSHKSVDSYNSTGESDSALYYVWDPEMGSWEIISRWVSTYNGNNILILLSHDIWDNIADQWLNFQKTEIGYDSSGNENLNISYNWDINSSQWIRTDSLELTFNESGNLTLLSHFNWDVNDEQWVGTWKLEDIYDGKNRVSSIFYQWNNNQWVYNYKYDQSYNANGKVILNLLYWYDGINNEWDIDSKDEYFYEENGLQYLRIFSSFNYDRWYLGSKYYSFNSIHVVTDLSKSSMANSLIIYPNPAKECINIQSTDPLSNVIQLYNHNGQLLKTVTLEHGLNTISISNLQSGLYFFKIPSKKSSESYKFIKTE